MPLQFTNDDWEQIMSDIDNVHEALSASCLYVHDTILIGPCHPGMVSDYEWIIRRIKESG